MASERSAPPHLISVGSPLTSHHIQSISTPPSALSPFPLAAEESSGSLLVAFPSLLSLLEVWSGPRFASVQGDLVAGQETCRRRGAAGREAGEEAWGGLRLSWAGEGGPAPRCSPPGPQHTVLCGVRLHLACSRGQGLSAAVVGVQTAPGTEEELTVVR